MYWAHLGIPARCLRVWVIPFREVPFIIVCYQKITPITCNITWHAICIHTEKFDTRACTVTAVTTCIAVQNGWTVHNIFIPGHTRGVGHVSATGASFL